MNEMWWVVLAVFCFNSGGGRINHHYLKTQYLGKHEGDIVLHLDGDMPATVKRVHWCGNMKGQTAPIHSCSSPGLYRAELFPSKNAARVLSDNTIHVDATSVGGWDSSRESRIVVETEYVDGQRVYHTFVFDRQERLPVHNDPEKGVAVHETQPIAVPPPTAASMAESPTTVSEERVEESQSYKGMLILLANGILVLLGVGYFAHRKRKSGMSLGEAYSALALSDFELVHSPFEDKTPEEAAEDDESMQLLMQMGEGANAVFLKNL